MKNWQSRFAVVTACSVALGAPVAHAGVCQGPEVSAALGALVNRSNCTDDESGARVTASIGNYFGGIPDTIAAGIQGNFRASDWDVFGYTLDVEGNLIADCQAVFSAPDFFDRHSSPACAEASTLMVVGVFRP